MTRDADGYFTYQGRDDDLLKVSGKWFSPREAEECLLEHPDVKEAAVVGIENEDGLAVPVAFVVPAAGADFRGVPTAIRAHLGESLESYKHPREVHLLAELPRTHLGKVDRGTLRRSREAKGDRASPRPRGGDRGARNRAGERTT